ncbi:MAG TPA: DUF3108 domain-containing protein [Thermoanaerobaculia bacterium]
MSVLLAAFLAATLTGAPAPVIDAFNTGETLDYSITWLKITGGSARMTIAPLEGSDHQFRITSIAKSNRGFRLFRFRDEIETHVTREEFSTVTYAKKLDERGDKKQESTHVDADGNVLRIKSTWTKPRRFKVQNPILDPISVIYYMRTLDLTPGKKYELRLLADGKRYNVHAKVVRRETIHTEAGVFKTVVVEPMMEAEGVEREEKLFIWYTDDERRLPVRVRTDVKVGSITASLKSVTSGVKSTEPPTTDVTKSK